MFPQGDTTGPKNRGLVFPGGNIAHPIVQRGYRRVGTVGFLTFFRAQLGKILAFSRQRTKRARGEKPRVRVRVVLPTPGVPGRGHCRPKFQHGFDSSLEYSTDRVVLFWHPPSYFSPWSPSSLVVDGVSYSWVEQYMMAEKASVFQDHRE